MFFAREKIGSVIAKGGTLECFGDMCLKEDDHLMCEIRNEATLYVICGQ